MKSTLTPLFILLSFTLASAQCMVTPWSLSQRVNNSNTVVEGKVIDQYGLWDSHHKNIYTINTIEVYKVFKGTVSTSTIRLVAEGGIVGQEMLKVSPSLQLQSDDVGIFMLVPNAIRIGESLTIKGTQYDNYELYSPSGQLVEQGNILSGQITLNVSSKGLFMLVLKTENHTVNYKITVIE
jgi:hypothetical protein